jgi:HK97 family phage prohead protease
MTKTAEGEIIKREIGEHVEIACHFEPDSVKALEDGVFEATITTSEVDRHGEVIVTEGINTDNWEKNSPTVLYGHDYYTRLPIGKGLSLKRFKNKLTAKFQIATKEYDFAATIAELIKGGYLTAVSIGGIVKEWSADYMKIMQMEMVEFSVVPIPANASAIITSKSLEDATGKTPEQIRREFQAFTKALMVDKLKAMGDDELTKSVKVLESLLATLKESIDANSSAGDDEPETVHKIKKLRMRESAIGINKESERTIRLLKLKTA